MGGETQQIETAGPGRYALQLVNGVPLSFSQNPHKQRLTDEFITQQVARKRKINDGYTISRLLELFERGEDLRDERLKTLKVPTLVL